MAPKGAVVGKEADPKGYDGFHSESPSSRKATATKLPHLLDYDIQVRRVVIVAVFLYSAIRQGACNYLTQSGIADESVVLLAVVKGISTKGIMFTAGCGLAQALGIRGSNLIVWAMTLFTTVVYSIVFAISPRLAPLLVVPLTLLFLAVGMPFCRRRIFAISIMLSIVVCQVSLVFIIQALPAFTGRVPPAARQFFVPVIKTLYVGFVTELLTLVWKKTYRKPGTPFLLSMILLMALVSQETMGVVGLLVAVDSDKIWSNAAIFCAVSIVMETNSRTALVTSWLYKMMGKQYRFSEAAHIFRWGKMWTSYCWLCAFAGWVVPALINQLEVKESKFNFLRWEPWALLGMYLAQQIATDLTYVLIQHRRQPSGSLSETAARCMILGQATPFFGANDADARGDCADSPTSTEADDEEYEPAGVKLGPLTISPGIIIMFVMFESTVSVWNNYVRGQFGQCGTFTPGWESGEAC